MKKFAVFAIVILAMLPVVALATHPQHKRRLDNTIDNQQRSEQTWRDNNSNYWDQQRDRGERTRAARRSVVSQQQSARRQNLDRYKNSARNQRLGYKRQGDRLQRRFDNDSNFVNLND